jgi:hypothetical protein
VKLTLEINSLTQRLNHLRAADLRLNWNKLCSYMLWGRTPDFYADHLRWREACSSSVCKIAPAALETVGFCVNSEEKAIAN